MSSTTLQIVSPRADGAYSGKTLAVDDRGPQVTMWRRTPMSYYHPRADAVVADIVQDTFTRRRFDVSGGKTVEVLCDDAMSFKDVVEHLLARDREFRRYEDKYDYEFGRWRQFEKAEAEYKFMEAGGPND